MKRKRKVGDWKLTEFGKAFIATLFALPIMAVYAVEMRDMSNPVELRVLFSTFLVISIIAAFINLVGTLDEERELKMSTPQYFILTAAPLIAIVVWCWVKLVSTIPTLIFEKVEHDLADSIDPTQEYYQKYEAWPDTIEVDGRLYYQDHETQTYKLIKGQDNA